jgi:hypothetical protein
MFYILQGIVVKQIISDIVSVLAKTLLIAILGIWLALGLLIKTVINHYFASKAVSEQSYIVPFVTDPPITLKWLSKYKMFNWG